MASKHLILGTILAFVPSTLLVAHITIWPKESAPGARERYTMRVPNEKQVATVRIEGNFPADLNVYDFEFKPGWKIDFKKDDKGKITGASWTGKIAPCEFVEFGMLGLNLKDGSSLTWNSCGVGIELEQTSESLATLNRVASLFGFIGSIRERSLLSLP